MEKTRPEIIKELEQKTFISVYHQYHKNQPYFVRCVKCGSKLLTYRDNLEYTEVWNILKEHKHN